MAARRGRSQARRNDGGGLPGWAWMILGIVIALAAVMFAPRLLKSDRADGFFRPQPNPSAQPAVSAVDEVEPPPVVRPADTGTVRPGAEPAPAGPEYDFYTVLPEQEVAMTDAELAATARAEEERRAREDAAAAARDEDAAEPATAAPPPTTSTTAAIEPGGDTPYVLQAGAFGSASDAESLKARIALLGLSARVEPAEVRGQTVYRVRMGPYRTASELAEAKAKLTGGGLPAMAIRAK